jgi:perosamine synthetase
MTEGLQFSAANLTDLAYYRGRVGLSSILRALGVGRGHAVALQAFTCCAVPQGIAAVGASPLYIDVGADSVNMDPQDLASKLAPGVRAVVVQHTFGIPAPIDQIVEIANARGVDVIEDCCHTLSSSYRGKVVGSFGRAAFYSFEWGKPLVAGLGGSVLTTDARLRARLVEQYSTLQRPPFARTIRIGAQYVAFRLLYTPQLYWYVKAAFRLAARYGLAEGNYSHGLIGDDEEFGYRMAPSCRARLARRLRDTDQATRARMAVASKYDAAFRRLGVATPTVPRDATPVYARYPLRVPDKARLLERARRARVELAEWYATPVHPFSRAQWHVAGYEAGTCARAEGLCTEVVSLPMHPSTADRLIDRIEKILN